MLIGKAKHVYIAPFRHQVIKALPSNSCKDILIWTEVDDRLTDSLGNRAASLAKTLIGNLSVLPL